MDKKREIISSAVFTSLKNFSDLEAFAAKDLLGRSLYGIDALIESLSLVEFLTSLESALIKEWPDRKFNLIHPLLEEELAPLASVDRFIDFLMELLHE